MRSLAIAVSFCLAAGGVALAGLAEVKKKDTLVVLTSPGYVPFEMRDKSGALVGFDVEIANRLKEAAGVAKLEWKEVAFEKLLDALAKGEGDLALSGISITEERKKSVDFSEPYKHVGLAVMTAAGKSAGEGTVVTAEGTTSVDAAKKAFPKAKLKTCKTEGDAAKEVLEGKADAMVFDAPFLRVFAKRHDGKVAVKDLPELPIESIGVAVAKGNADLLKLVNETLGKLRKDGTLEKLENAYFIEMTWLASVPAE